MVLRRRRKLLQRGYDCLKVAPKCAVLVSIQQTLLWINTSLLTYSPDQWNYSFHLVHPTDMILIQRWRSCLGRRQWTSSQHSQTRRDRSWHAFPLGFSRPTESVMRCGLPSACCSALCASKPADAADSAYCTLRLPPTLLLICSVSAVEVRIDPRT